MKLTPIKSIKTGSEDLNTGGFLLLLSVAVILSFTVFLWRADQSSKKPIDNGTVQETVGDRIQVLGRFDQERQTRLQQQWDRTVQQFTAFVNGRDERQQEILGQSITSAAQMIRMEQERLHVAIMEAGNNLDRFYQEKPARRQEKLGKAVLAAYRRAPEGGVAFQLAFERETNRLRIVESRTARSLESNLNSLMTQEAGFRDAIPGMYREAIESARRSAQMLEASQMAWTGRVLDTLRTDLSWQRQSEDYIQLVGAVREILRGFRGVGGFLEYGWPALIGLLAAMTWLGLTIPKGPPVNVDAATEEPVIELNMPKAA
jgi:hypothetical protein